MPYDIRKKKNKRCVYNTDTGEEKHCFDTLKEAEAYMRALYANIPEARRANDLSEDEAAFILAAAEKAPNEKLYIHREASGRYRWFAWPACTAFVNRDMEIDSTILFDNFIDRIEKTGQWPYLTFWHQAENFRMGEADFVARDGVAYLCSGLFDETKLAREAIQGLQREKEYWGTSIRYKPIGPPSILRYKGQTIPVYEDGEHIEISILPEIVACSIFTAIPITKE